MTAMRTTTNILAIALLATIPASYPADAQVTASRAGATPGDVDVGAGGEATYRIEINVPPGIHGVQPQLAISYSSNTGNGHLGVGWSIEGLSSITRVGPTAQYDGDSLKYAHNRLDPTGATDRFALDGQRLIMVKNQSGTLLNSTDYGQPGTVYRTAVESGMEVTSNGREGNGPGSFSVRDKDGSTREYGSSSDSRVKLTSGSATNREWALRTHTDANGNTMTFSYQVNGALDMYISTIDYTTNTRAGAARAKNRVEFIYEDRADKSPTWRAGQEIKIEKRLGRIKTWYKEQLVRTYNFRYDYGKSTGRSRLAGIQECAGASGCMPETAFSYSDMDANWRFHEAIPGGMTPNRMDGNCLLRVGDFNGDGKMDILRQTQDSSFYVLYALGNGQFEVHVPPGDAYQNDLRNNPGARIIPGDYDGDGVTDFIRQEQNGWDDNTSNTFNVYYSTASGGLFEIYSPSGTEYQDHLREWAASIIPGDFDGDGRMDFIRQEHNDADWDCSATFRIYFSQGRRTNFKIVTPGSEVSGDMYQDWLRYDPGAEIIPGDFNGDGRTDFLRRERGDWGKNDSQTFQVYFSRGDGTFDRVEPSGVNYQYDLRDDLGANIIPGDFNGDGLLDFIRQERGGMDDDTRSSFRVYFSKGDGGFSFVEPNGDEYQDALRYDPGVTISVGDFNGDGRADFLRQAREGLAGRYEPAVYYSRGDGHFIMAETGGAHKEGMNSNVTNSTVGDFNGDGIDDLVFVEKRSGRTGWWIYTVTPPKDAPRPDFLVGVTDGLKKAITISYKPLTDSSVYTKGANATYPVVAEQSPQLVVSSLEMKDGNGSRSAVTYSYEQMRSRRDGCGGRGFYRVSKTSEGVTQTTTYHQDPELGGHPERVTQKDGSNTLMVTRYDYRVTYPHPNVVQVLTKSEETDQFVNNVHKYTTSKSYTYDSIGNMTLLSDLGKAGETAVYTSAQYNGPYGFTGLLTARKHGKTNVVNAASAWRSDVDLDQESFGYDQRGNLVNADRWDDVNARWISNQYKVDAYGNVVEVRDSRGYIASLVWDDDHLYIKERTIRADADTPAITTRMTQDNRFGVQISQTDPNGQQVIYELDDLGRVTAMRGPRSDGTGGPVLLERISLANNDQGLVSTTKRRVAWDQDDESTWYWEKEYTDGFGRLYRKESRGFGGATVVEEQTTFDGQSRVKTRSLPYKQGETPSTITFAYDATGLPTNVDFGDMKLTFSRLGDGLGFNRRQTGTDIAERSTNYVVNSRQKVAEMSVFWNIDAKDWDINIDRKKLVEILKQKKKPAEVTKFEYDALLRPTRVIDPAGVSHTTRYDSLSQKVEVSNADRGTTRFTYDSGQLKTETDARGNRTTFDYDGVGRVKTKKIEWLKGTTPMTTLITYTYDAATDPARFKNVIGNLWQVTRKTNNEMESEYRYGYDAYGRVALFEVRLPVQEKPFIFRYAYDAQGKESSEVFPDNAEAIRVYDASGELSTLALKDAVNGARNAQQAVVASYEGYSARREPTAIRYGNGVFAENTYGGQRGTISRAKVRTGASSSVTLLDEKYHYDSFGDVLKIEDVRTGAGNASYDPLPFKRTTQDFAYDQLGRLVKAVADDTYGTLDFNYFRGGILTKNGDVRYVPQYRSTPTAENPIPDVASHRIALVTAPGRNPEPIRYDDSGNTTARGDLGYVYDGENRLIEVTSGGKVVSRFTYDDAGRRICKSDGEGNAATKTWYVADDYEVTVLPASAGQASSTLHTKYVDDEKAHVASFTRNSGEVTIAVAMGPTEERVRGVIGGVAERVARAAGLVVPVLLTLFMLAAARRRRPGATGPAGLPARAQSPAWVRYAAATACVAMINYVWFSSEAFANSNGLSANANGLRGVPVAGVLYFHQNDLGSTDLVLDQTGKLVSRVAYRPFGEVDVSSAGVDGFRAKHGARELDAGANLYYSNARYYDPLLGRFLTADSELGAGYLKVDAFNRYAYAGNNPIRNVDPSGHSFLVKAIIVAVKMVVALAVSITTQIIAGQWTPGKAATAMLRAGIRATISALLGAAVTKVLEKAVSAVTKTVTKGVKIAIQIASGIITDAAMQASVNGLEIARGNQVDWGKSMVTTVLKSAFFNSIGAVVGSYLEDTPDGRDSKSKSASNPGGNTELSRADWGELAVDQLQNLTSAAGEITRAVFTGSATEEADPGKAMGIAYSTSGQRNSPMYSENGYVIVNVMGRATNLATALKKAREELSARNK